MAWCCVWDDEDCTEDRPCDICCVQSQINDMRTTIARLEAERNTAERLAAGIATFTDYPERCLEGVLRMYGNGKYLDAVRRVTRQGGGE